MPTEPSRLPVPHRLTYEPLLRLALVEDLGAAGDVTTDALTLDRPRAIGRIVAKASGRIAGLEPALTTFLLLEPGVAIEAKVADGADVSKGMVVAIVKGEARTILTGERVCLNLLGRLSGIATATRQLVQATADHKVQIADTRKTTPGLRSLEKYAVRVGGGSNHRFGLDDAVLIKDNHIALVGSIAQAVAGVRARVGHLVKVEVEVQTLSQLEAVLELGVDAVLLDNMTVEELAAAVSTVNRRLVTEASGGIHLGNAAAIAATGVDLMSVGWITHSAPVLDVSMDLEFPRGRVV